MEQSKSTIIAQITQLLEEINAASATVLNTQETPQADLILLGAKVDYLSAHIKAIQALSFANATPQSQVANVVTNSSTDIIDTTFTPASQFGTETQDEQKVVEEISEVTTVQTQGIAEEVIDIEQAEDFVPQEEAPTEEAAVQESLTPFEKIKFDTTSYDKPADEATTEESDSSFEQIKFDTTSNEKQAYEAPRFEESRHVDHKEQAHEAEKPTEAEAVESPKFEESVVAPPAATETKVEPTRNTFRTAPEVTASQEAVHQEVRIEAKSLLVEESVPISEEKPAQPARPLTLNEMIQQQKLAGANLTQQFQTSTSSDRISDLKVGISLNDKLMFIKDLFNGYSLAYSEAIELLNRFDNFAAADAFLQSNYALKNGWAEKPQTVEKLYTVLRKKFAN